MPGGSKRRPRKRAVSLTPVKRRDELLEAVSDISTRLASASDPDSVVEAVAESLNRLVPASCIYVAIWDRSVNAIRFPYYYEGKRRDHQPNRPFANGLTEYVLNSRKTLHIARNFATATKRRKIEWRGTPSKSWLGAPLLLGDEAVGVVAAYDNDREDAFTKRHEAILEALAAQAAVALRNAGLLKEAETSRERLRKQQATLRRLARDALRSPRSEGALSEIVRAAARTLGVERASVWLFNKDHTRIECVELYQQSSGSERGGAELTAADYPAYFRALDDDRTIAAEDSLADPRTSAFAKSYLRPLGIGALLDAPIRVEGRVVGVACHEHVGGARPWTLDEQNFAGSIADMAALALEREKTRRAEAEVQLIATIATRVAQAPDLAAALKVALAESCEAADWVVGEAWLPSADGGQLEPSSAWWSTRPGLEAFHAANSARVFRKGEGLPGRAFATGKAAWATDLQEKDDFVRAPAAAAAGLTSAFAIPVSTAKGVVAVLEFFRAGQRRDPGRLGLVEALAAQLGAVIERKRAEDALREQMQLYETLLRAQSDLGEGFLLYDPRTQKALYVNEALLKIGGRTREEFEQVSLLDLASKENREMLAARIRSRLEGGHADEHYELEERGKDGVLRSLEIAVKPLRTPSGLRVIALVRDITERKLAEDNLRKQKTLYETLLKAQSDVGEAFLVVDPIGQRVLYANEAVEKLSGYTLAELGSDFVDRLPEETQEIFAERLMRRLAGEPVEDHFEVPIETKDGRRIDVEIAVQPFTENDELRLVFIARDVTERKRLAAELQKYADNLERLVAERTRDLDRTKRNLETVFQNTVDGFLFVDEEMNLASANGRFSEFFGFEGDEILHLDKDEARNRARSRLKDPRKFDEGLRAYEPARRHLPYASVLELVDGRVLQEESLPIFEGGRYAGRVWTYHDITERKRLEEELLRYAQTLEAEVERRTTKLLQAAKMAALGQLVAGVAHEINNPLAFVKSNTALIREEVHGLLSEPAFVDALEGRGDPHAAAEWLRESERWAFVRADVGRLLEMNLRGLTRISDIVQRLRTFASPQLPRKEPTDLSAVVRETASIFLAQFAPRIHLEEEYAEVPPVVCDAGQLGQVIMNLLVNAGQAIEGEGTVRVGLRREGDRAILTISDSGVGMAPDVARRVFDPFFTTKDRGTGLGLSISYSIVKEHRGDIAVETEPGKGTTMIVTLPIGG